MAGLIFDTESNGFLKDLTKIHCIAYRDEAGGEVKSVGGKTDEKIRNFLTHLEDAPVLIGHNIIEHDIPALKKVYPTFNPKGELWDTLLDCQTIWTDLKDRDFAFQRKNPDFPTKHIGRHSLKAWGVRLGVYKIDILKQLDSEDDAAAAFAEWTQELEDYCRQDVVVGAALYEKIKNHERFSKRAHDMEMEFKQYMLDQEREGFPFDEKAAHALYAELAAERAQLEHDLKTVFPPWEVSLDFIPKRDNKTKGYVKGVVFKKTKLVEFNPRSHPHIAKKLIEKGWKPEEFTDAGAPCTDSDVLEALVPQFPECKLLARHGEIQKIIGMVAEGKSAYLKKLSPDLRLRGRVGTCGTVTGRCAHKEPNLGNIPRKGDLGKRVRKLFVCIPGYKLVGADAKGLELRMLAHFLARIDGGAYCKVVVEGDPHEFNRVAAGLEKRDDAKTFIYAYVYGGGDGKLGLIVGKGPTAGRALRLKFEKQFKALGQLKAEVAAKAKANGCINGLDGRKLHIRAIYSSLNTLLQSAGALVMKMAVVLFNREIRKRGWYQDGSVRQVAMVHDEIQSLVRVDLVEAVEQLKVECIRKAGEHFCLRCATDGDAKHGESWGDTH